FIGFLNLWNHLREQRRELSGNAFRRMCRDEFLHYLRIREWQDLHGQLRTIAQSLGITPQDEPAPVAAVHAALASGLLSQLGMRPPASTREYLGARNTRFVLAPGSVLSKHPPAWVIVAELVETSRLYGRIAARIEPESLEHLAEHLVVRTYSEPHWDARRGAATAFERVTLYGLPLVARRRINYARIDEAGARELFIRHALVEGDWTTRHRFVADNAALREQLAGLEERERRRGLLADDDTIFAWYDARIPASVVSARHFDAWWKKTRSRTPDLLTMTRDDLLVAPVDDEEHPSSWTAGDDLDLPVTYRFAPGAEDDGVTVHVPVDVLARLGAADFAWQVPALREELVIELFRSLPKELRRAFVPVPDTARAVLAELQPGGEPLLPALQRLLHRRSGVLVPIDAFDLAKVPPHLRVTFAVEAPSGEVLARGKDLPALQEALATQVQQAVSASVSDEYSRVGLRDWPDDLAELPRVVERTSTGHVVRGFPAFVDAGSSVELRVFPTEPEQAAAMPAGVRRLVRLTVPSPVKPVERSVGPRSRLVLAANPDGSLGALIDDCADAAVDALLTSVPWMRADFVALRQAVASRIVGETQAVLGAAEKVLTAAHEARTLLPTGPVPAAQREAIDDVRDQFRRILPQGFVTATGRRHLPDLARWVTAMTRRLERLSRELDVDAGRMARVRVVQDALDTLVAALPPLRARGEDVRDVARLIQEFRVSLWAQQLGTARPVSEQRIFRALDAIAP
ncbi:MAG: ATP-dependent RNA helicase HrpA, partial [Jatrophihabitans sp.]|uniref:ATP-dependent RNA helicase HrpA n=1 Tax=Jatrophihabitans sp. TaxID=1932789 RepID=UPI003F81707A